jgi:hypothetical protein
MRRIIVAAAAALAACSAGSRATDRGWGPPVEARTQAVLVGELCEHGEPCACRDERAPGLGGVSGPDGPVPAEDELTVAGSAPAPSAPGGEPPRAEAKRVELRLRSSHDLWLRVGDATFYKDRERAEACFYIDLSAPGIGERPKSYPVELRASNPDGVSAELVVNELGAAARTWYQTVRFSCGVPGACSFDELDAVKAEAARAVKDHTLYDPCGSIRAKELRWDSRVAPDHAHPGDLALTLSLEVFHFMPTKPHGDPGCGK